MANSTIVIDYSGTKYEVPWGTSVTAGNFYVINPDMDSQIQVDLPTAAHLYAASQAYTYLINCIRQLILVDQ
jgi:hypothetical protein